MPSDDATTLSVRQAGRRGGLATLRKHGLDHLRAAGRKGAASVRARYDRGNFVEWGKRGGRPRKPTLAKMREARSASPTEVNGEPTPDLDLPLHFTTRRQQITTH